MFNDSAVGTISGTLSPGGESGSALWQTVLNHFLHCSVMPDLRFANKTMVGGGGISFSGGNQVLHCDRSIIGNRLQSRTFVSEIKFVFKMGIFPGTGLFLLTK